MNIIKKLILTITAMLASIAFVTSCSKEPEVKVGKKGKKVPVEAKAKAKSIPSDGKNTLNATRKGQHVDLNWQIGSPGGKITQINIFRSATGVSKKRKVADLAPDAVSFKDTLPDENAYWYWVRLLTADSKVQEIGPVRVDEDRAGAAHYTKQADKYIATITRTDELATLKWDFPEDEYKQIKVVRAVRPVTQPFMPGKSHLVVTTLERKSQCDDALPGANAEYWYWFQITLKSGEVIYKGPIKAEFPRRSTPAVKSGKK